MSVRDCVHLFMRPGVIPGDRNCSEFFKGRRRSSACPMEDGLAEQSGEAGSAVSMCCSSSKELRENIF